MTTPPVNLNGVLAWKCKQCSETKELTLENWYTHRKKCIQPCKECFRARNRQYAKTKDNEWRQTKKMELLARTRPAYYQKLMEKRLCKNL